MDLLTLIAVLAIVGFCLWLIVNYIPMPEPFTKVIIAIVVIVLVLWVAKMLFGQLGVPNLR